MDGLGQLFSNFAGFLGGGANPQTGATPTWTKLLTGGLLGAGELGNIIQGQKQSSMQDYLINLAKNPQLLSKAILKAQQPIQNSLIQGVTNQVQGDLASRGLSQAPGIFGATESQALAPYWQQNYNTAQQQVMQQLGLAEGSVQGNPTNLSPAMQSFMRTFGFNTGTGGQTNPAAWTVPPQNTGQGGGIITPPSGSPEVMGVPPDGSDLGVWGG